MYVCTPILNRMKKFDLKYPLTGTRITFSIINNIYYQYMCVYTYTHTYNIYI